jgi:hypothetical protein
VARSQRGRHICQYGRFEIRGVIENLRPIKAFDSGTVDGDDFMVFQQDLKMSVVRVFGTKRCNVVIF